MATLYITEYESLVVDPNNYPIQIPKEPHVATQAITISSSHAESSQFNALTKFVRITTDTDCYVIFGDSSVQSTTSHPLLSANAVEYRGITAESQYLSAVTT